MSTEEKSNIDGIRKAFSFLFHTFKFVEKSEMNQDPEKIGEAFMLLINTMETYEAKISSLERQLAEAQETASFLRDLLKANRR